MNLLGLDGFRPNAVEVVWVVINASGVIVKLGIIWMLYAVHIPLLKRYGKWQRVGIRRVVHRYMRADWSRLGRLTGYLLVGVLSMFLPAPVRQGVKVFVDYLIPGVFLAAVCSEVFDAVLDFNYRREWVIGITLTRKNGNGGHPPLP